MKSVWIKLGLPSSLPLQFDENVCEEMTVKGTWAVHREQTALTGWRCAKQLLSNVLLPSSTPDCDELLSSADIFLNTSAVSSSVEGMVRFLKIKPSRSGSLQGAELLTVVCSNNSLLWFNVTSLVGWKKTGMQTEDRKEANTKSK